VAMTCRATYIRPYRSGADEFSLCHQRLLAARGADLEQAFPHRFVLLVELLGVQLLVLSAAPSGVAA